MPLAAGGEVRALNGLLNAVYVSLHSDDPMPNGVNEIAVGSYARTAGAFTNSGSNPTTAANSGAIQFPQASADWGDVTHFGIWSASVGGTFLGGEPLTATKNIGTGDIARFPIGALQVISD